MVHAMVLTHAHNNWTGLYCSEGCGGGVCNRTTGENCVTCTLDSLVAYVEMGNATEVKIALLVFKTVEVVM